MKATQQRGDPIALVPGVAQLCTLVPVRARRLATFGEGFEKRGFQAEHAKCQTSDLKHEIDESKRNITYGLITRIGWSRLPLNTVE